MAKKNKAKGAQKEAQAANSNNKSQEKSQKSQDPMARNIVIAALIIILLLAGIGFLIFGIVQSVTDKDNNNDNSVETVDDGDDDEDEAEADDSDDDDDDSDNEGSVNGDGVCDGDDDEGDSEEGQTSKYPATSTTYRRGNDYKLGDIEGNSYTIEKGDTLWQIAEGRYGSGYAWVDINKANGGFSNLPNGRPVLLKVGQTIVLPNL